MSASIDDRSKWPWVIDLQVIITKRPTKHEVAKVTANPTRVEQSGFDVKVSANDLPEYVDEVILKFVRR